MNASRPLYGEGNNSPTIEDFIKKTGLSNQYHKCRDTSLEENLDSLNEVVLLPNMLQTDLENDNTESVMGKPVGNEETPKDTFYQIRWYENSHVNDTIE